MSTAEDEFLSQLRATFAIEAAEHLQAIGSGLLALEKAPAPAAQRELVATVFRAAHCLKGAARAVEFAAIESHCQALEDRFAAWKHQDGAPAAASFDTAHRAIDAIARLLGAAPAPRPPRPVPAVPAPAPVRPEPERPAAGGPALSPAQSPPSPAEETKPFAAGDTVRIAVAKLDARLEDAEEMLTAKLALDQRAEDLRSLAGALAPWHRDWTAIEPGTRTLRHNLARPAPGSAPAAELGALLDFFDRNLAHHDALACRVAAFSRAAEQDRLVIGQLVDDLLESSKQLLLLPFAALAPLFVKLVRDLSRDLGKETELVLHGEDVEIDKRILAEMKDPLIHLLRNCVDHGIELPDRRLALGKPARGTLTLTIARVDGSKVEILVADDGAGIDVARIKAAATKLHLLTAEAAPHLGDAAARALVFQAEVSTSPQVTRLSGRGLGLAIVREKAEKLGGTVAVESQPGQGSCFRILLPSSLATFRGVLIEAAGRGFVVPTAQLDCVAQVREGDMQTVAGRATLAWRGRTIPQVRLADVLALPAGPARGTSAGGAPVMILGRGDERIAFAVDAVRDEQEVLVKPLRPPLARVRHVAGATVLASGRLVPVLHVADLLRSARQIGGLAPAVARPAAAPARPPALLVVEDSITSRLLLKGILETAGYRVQTAVDGQEAFTRLRTESFDLVVSDVEMPRLNGFELTARIRADRKLADLPVVLVTALETREDRERGIAAGANAYLVKSSFDRSNLLDVVRRLLDS